MLASAISSTCSWWKPFDVAAEPHTNIYLRVTFASSRADVISYWIHVQRIPGTSDEVPIRASGTKHTTRNLCSRDYGLAASGRLTRFQYVLQAQNTPHVIYVVETAVWRPRLILLNT